MTKKPIVSKTLVIDNVNFKLLDTQRHALARVIDNRFQPEDIILLEGLHSMLEHWSDREYFNNHPELSINTAINKEAK